MNVVITNRNEEAYERRYDGTLYRFPPGEAITVPDVAAAYLFGYGQDEAARRRIVVRNGWQQRGLPEELEAAMKRLKNFVFKKAAPEPEPEKRKKTVLPAPQLARQPTGINAISPDAKDDGKTILPRSAARLPGGAPLAPPLPSTP